MNKFILVFVLSLLPVTSFASGSDSPLDKAKNDITDQASLQRGAKYFVNYCLSCHSASYMRYSRMAKDLGMSEDQVMANLMFAADKVGETMNVAMRKQDARNWFGTSAPDLSVVARSRGTDWLYTYLRSFYIDESRPFGVNNTVFKDVAMPDVLWALQGLQKPVYVKEKSHNSDEEHEVFKGFEIVQQGSMTKKEYDNTVRDLVNFIDYMGEPAQLQRKKVGPYVIIFLIIFLIVSYRMKKAFWKDIH